MEPATQAVAQVVQAAALVVVLKVDPATQEVHPVFAVVVQVVLLRVPAAHAGARARVPLCASVTSVACARALPSRHCSSIIVIVRTWRFELERT